MNRLAVGMNVEIKRSDGRVHMAIISDILPNKNSVHVEWFEKGETKGKEIDIASLLEINPTLQPKDAAAAQPHANRASNHSSSQASNRTAYNLNGLSDSNDENETLDQIKLPTPPKRPTAAATKRKTVVGGQQSHGQEMHNEPAVQPSQQKAVSRQDNKSSAPAPSISKPSSSLNMTIAAESVTNGKSSNLAAAANSTITNVGSHHAGNTNTAVGGGGNANSTSSLGFALPTSITQKSSTVANIEKMQKEREERRAAQERDKKRQELEKQLDPGNPNYQFLVMIRDYQSQLDYRPLKMSDSVAENRITVCVRKRPMSKKELGKKEIEVITIPNRDHVIVHQPQVKVDLTKYLDNAKFRYDYAFDESASNEMVYRFTAQPLVRTLFEGGHATCFAYGQTGSGKTHTMGGDFTSAGKGALQNAATGIYALTAADIFKMLHTHKGCALSCAFFEIYGSKVFDLLNDKKLLRVLEDGKREVQVVGLSEETVTKEKDVIEVIKKGSAVRTAGTTSANINSSRSHAVFQFILRKGKKIHGRFSLVDLAGNERGQDTGNSDRQTRVEGAEINKSLLALKECIRAMGRRQQHVPFRGNVLMQVLRDSFIGPNSKTCMIAMISPSMSSCEHTMNTLRYAYQVKELDVDGTGQSSAQTPMDNAELMLPRRGISEEMGLEEDEQEAEEEAEVALLCNQSGANKAMTDYYRLVTKLTHAETKTLNSMNVLLDELDSQYEKSQKVEYDQEEFVRSALEKFTQAETKIATIKNNLRAWQKLLQEECEASSSLRHKK